MAGSIRKRTVRVLVLPFKPSNSSAHLYSRQLHFLLLFLAGSKLFLSILRLGSLPVHGAEYALASSFPSSLKNSDLTGTTAGWNAKCNRNTVYLHRRPSSSGQDGESGRRSSPLTSRHVRSEPVTPGDAPSLAGPFSRLSSSPSSSNAYPLNSVLLSPCPLSPSPSSVRACLCQSFCPFFPEEKPPQVCRCGVSLKRCRYFHPFFLGNHGLAIGRRMPPAGGDMWKGKGILFPTRFLSAYMRGRQRFERMCPSGTAMAIPASLGGGVWILRERRSSM